VTEAEWNNSDEPTAMLEFLRSVGKLSDRKARLFAVSCCRRVWHRLDDGRVRQAVRAAERFADGGASAEQLEQRRRVLAGGRMSLWVATREAPISVG
jgi:hypothetical protein